MRNPYLFFSTKEAFPQPTFPPVGPTSVAKFERSSLIAVGLSIGLRPLTHRTERHADALELPHTR